MTVILNTKHRILILYIFECTLFLKVDDDAVRFENGKVFPASEQAQHRGTAHAWLATDE